jgi:hypothetical protein
LACTNKPGAARLANVALVYCSGHAMQRRDHLHAAQREVLSERWNQNGSPWLVLAARCPRECGWGAMLHKLTEKQAVCLEVAARCRARAQNASDPTNKQDYLDMAERWEMLAKSYGLTERLKDYIASQKRGP